MGETNVEIVTDTNEIKERGITIIEPMPIMPQPIIEPWYSPQETRAERRAKARKKKPK